MGVSGSGKTTIGELLASKLECPFLEGDDFHSRKNIEKMSKGIPLSDTDRHPWLTKIATEIKRRSDNKEKCVLACSALKRKYRDIIFKGIKYYRLIYLTGTIEDIRARMEKRNHFMPTTLLISQFRALEPPLSEENFITIETTQRKEECVKDILTKFASTSHYPFSK